MKDGVSAPASGWGREHALEAWGSFWTDGYYDLGTHSGGRSVIDIELTCPLIVCGDQDPE